MYGKMHDSSASTIYEKLREQILHLELLPGTNVSEIETASKYEISRTPVRDAFKMLESEGLLEIRPHVGTFVTPIDLNMLSDTLYVRNVLEQAVLKDLSNQHPDFEDFSVQLLLKRQEALLNESMSTEELSRAFIISDDDFHNLLFHLAGRENIGTFISPLMNQYERFRTFINLYMPDNMQTLYEDHRLIWEYITRQETDLLEDRMTHHIYDGFNASSQIVFEHPEYFIGEP